ncbi:hypothetical protein [Micromonospora ureilytica]|uniref:Pentapeptide repeat-containing protein n=1 Tax=Micromonospora ureilytica TaxID=709868 RepID=A0ABS0JHY2_9ACTN|nr:hypothetical protein [Micromonospora ureilytica]MBG6066681.1 hypothetical protein [Micromonospora ureilytica]WSR59793.1 hypothetical protein OG400_17115 [Micromonospora ureilytica]
MGQSDGPRRAEAGDAHGEATVRGALVRGATVRGALVRGATVRGALGRGATG